MYRSLDSPRSFDYMGVKKECTEMIDDGMQSKQEVSKEKEALFRIGR